MAVPGTWVVWKGKIATIDHFSAGEVAIHLVDKNGETVMRKAEGDEAVSPWTGNPREWVTDERVVPWSELREALAVEIPKSRRGQ